MSLSGPRGSDFVYTDLEVETMLTDIRAAERNRGYLFCAGCADERSKVGPEGHAALLAACGEAEVVFHMAFDELAPYRSARSD